MEVFSHILYHLHHHHHHFDEKKKKNTFLNVQTRIRYMYKCICEENKCVFVCRDVTANGKRLHDARNIGKHPDMKCMYLMHQHAMPCNSKTKAHTHTHTALTYMMSRGWNWNFAYIYLVFRLCVILYAGKKLRVANSKQWPLLPNQSRAHKHTHTLVWTFAKCFSVKIGVCKR